MSAYRPYPKTKPSGVEWLGDVPAGWEVARIKNVATINASKSEVSRLDSETEVSFLPMEAVGDDGSLDTSTTRQLGDVLTGYTYVRENDVLVAKITPCFENGKGCIARGLNNGIGFATTEVVPIRPNKRSIPEFLYYLLHGLPFRKVAEGSMYGAGGQKRVSDNFVAGYSFALPPIPEQIQIASFLDRECGKLDALQAKQERLIELLKEKRQALISHTVTKGLDPNAKLKPSGIEWLGDVPVHWPVMPLDYHFTIQLGKMLDSNKITGKNLRPYLRVFDVQWGGINTEDLPLMDFDEDARLKFRLKIGDLLVNEGGSYPGRSAIWMGEIGECYYQKALHRIRPRRPSKSSTEFLFYIMRWATDYGVFAAGGNEATIEHLPAEKLRKYRFPLPPLAEQRAIVAHLDDRCGRMDALIAKAERAIALLKERRSALISAAVMGRIDVRAKIKMSC